MTGPADPGRRAPQAAGPGHGRSRKVVLVTGRVQGVGFRMATAREAGRLGVVGSVRNLPDGTVEADVEGPQHSVSAMVDWLRSGPSSARVDDLDVRQEHPRGAEDFRVT